MSEDERRARREVERCRKNISQGGNPKFWIWRIGLAVQERQAALDVLSAQLHELVENVAVMDSHSDPGATP